MDSTKVKRTRRQPIALVVGLGIVGIALFLIFNNRFLKPVEENGGMQPAPAKDNIETRFREDGTLTFRKADGTATQIRIEIAETDQARTQGMMGRKVMRRDQGMLFVFPDAEPRAFWMVNTPLSLDIIFVGADKRIVRIHPDATPYSDASLPSDKAAQYTIEVVAGFCAEHGIAEGDEVEWMR